LLLLLFILELLLLLRLLLLLSTSNSRIANDILCLGLAGVGLAVELIANVKMSYKISLKQ
jgi:hypothetical protein